jgi:hypothetical protein
VSQYKPALIHVDPEDWEIFHELCGNYRVSARVRELVKRDIEEQTRQECKAQSLAGLTES